MEDLVSFYYLKLHFFVAFQDAGIGTSIDSFYEYLLKVSFIYGNG